MRVDVLDTLTLSALQPAQLAAYMRSHGWRDLRADGRAMTWQRFLGDEEFEALVPERRTADYVLRVRELVQTLEAVEQRSQLDLLVDLVSSSADVVRIRLDSGTDAAGSVELDDAVSLVEGTRELMLAAACAAVEPRAYFAGRRPTPAVEFIEGLRMGQTERGSYGLALFASVPPVHSTSDDLLFEVEEPFNRLATSGLWRSLRAAREATDSALRTGELDVFATVVSEGVSANLCLALSSMMSERGASSRDLSFQISWASARPVQLDDAPIQFTEPDLEVLGEAGKTLRARSTVDDFEVAGHVVHLHREKGDEEGTATVEAPIDGQFRRVRTDLAGDDFRIAIAAFDQRALLRCEGELARQGRGYVLRNPRRVTRTSIDDE